MTRRQFLTKNHRNSRLICYCSLLVCRLSGGIFLESPFETKYTGIAAVLEALFYFCQEHRDTRDRPRMVVCGIYKVIIDDIYCLQCYSHRCQLLQWREFVKGPCSIKNSSALIDTGGEQRAMLSAQRTAFENVLSSFLESFSASSFAPSSLLSEFLDSWQINCPLLVKQKPGASPPGHLVPGQQFTHSESVYILGLKLLIGLAHLVKYAPPSSATPKA